MFRVDIFGELHTIKERQRIEREIVEIHRRTPYQFILSEECGNYEAYTTQAKRKGIEQEIYSIGPNSYYLGIKLNIPVIGIDSWDSTIDWNNISTANAFSIREKRMVEVIKEYMTQGNIAVIVGDSHLRTIRTPELGDISPIYMQFKNKRNVRIIRSPIGEIE